MNKQKHKNTKSNKESAQKSKKKNEDPEVFVVSPDILKKLGIHLNNVSSNSKTSAVSKNTDVGFASNKATCSSIETTPKFKLQQNMKKPTTSLLETAILMKKSVLLSPTFIPSNTNELSGEVEIANVVKDLENYDSNIKQSHNLAINKINTTRSPKYTITSGNTHSNVIAQKLNKKKTTHDNSLASTSHETIPDTPQNFDSQETCIVHVPVEYVDEIDADKSQDSTFLTSLQVTNQPMYTYNIENNFRGTNHIGNKADSIGTINHDVNTNHIGHFSKDAMKENNVHSDSSQIAKPQLVSVPEYFQNVNPSITYRDFPNNQFQFNPNVLQQPIPTEDNHPADNKFIAADNCGLNANNFNNNEVTALTCDKLPDIDIIFDENGDCFIELPTECEGDMQCLEENCHEKNDVISEIRYIDQLITESKNISSSYSNDHTNENLQYVDEVHNTNKIAPNLKVLRVDNQIETSEEENFNGTNEIVEPTFDTYISNPKHYFSLPPICLSNEKSEIKNVTTIQNIHSATNNALKNYSKPNTEVITIDSNNDNISQKCIQGVEKPGGSTSTTKHCSIKSFRTYQRKKPTAAPISCEISGNPDDLSVTLNFCLCSDFGRLAFYDSADSYMHLHFCDKHSMTIDPEIVFEIYEDDTYPNIDKSIIKTSEESFSKNFIQQLNSAQSCDLMQINAANNASTEICESNSKICADTSADINCLGNDKELKKDSNNSCDSNVNVPVSINGSHIQVRKLEIIKKKIKSVLDDDMKMEQSKSESVKYHTVSEIINFNSIDNNIMKTDNTNESIKIFAKNELDYIDDAPNKARQRRSSTFNLLSRNTPIKNNEAKNAKTEDNAKAQSTSNKQKSETQSAVELRSPSVKDKSNFKNVSNEISAEDVASGTNSRASRRRSSIINKVEDTKINNEEKPSTPKAKINADKEGNSKRRLSKLRKSCEESKKVDYKDEVANKSDLIEKSVSKNVTHQRTSITKNRIISTDEESNKKENLKDVLPKETVPDNVSIRSHRKLDQKININKKQNQNKIQQKVTNASIDKNATKSKTIKTYRRASEVRNRMNSSNKESAIHNKEDEKSSKDVEKNETVPDNIPTHSRRSSNKMEDKAVRNKEEECGNFKEESNNISTESLPENIKRKRKSRARNIIESDEDKSHDEETLNLNDLKKKKNVNITFEQDSINIENKSQFAQDILNIERTYNTADQRSPKKRKRNSFSQCDSEPNTGSPNISSYKPKRKRNVKSANTSAVENDTSVVQNKAPCASSSVSVICGLCQLDIPSAEWIEHIGKKHEYLAWKEGENLDINNKKMVKDHFNKILAESGLLICYKCGLRRKYAKPFMTHISECKDMPDNGGLCNLKDTNSLMVVTNNEEYQINHSGQVTCGVCHKIMDGTDWFLHIKSSHDYLARIDKYPPLDINNKDAVYIHVFSLIRYLGELSCLKCGAVRKNIVAYYNHSKQCSKSNDIYTKTSIALSKKDIYECAMCSENVKAKLWKKHVMEEHYNIAWVVGDYPIDMDNPYAVTKYLKEYQKRHDNRLICKSCKQTRASYAGFYAHILTCGKSEEELDKVREACTICNYKYLRIHKNQHMRYHREQESAKERKQSAIENQATVNAEMPIDSVPLGRRHAAVKASKVIENYKDKNQFKYNCSSCGYAADVKRLYIRHKCKKDEDVISPEESSEESDNKEDEGDDSDEMLTNDSDDERERRPAPRKSSHFNSDPATKIIRIPFVINSAEKYEIKGAKDFMKYHYTTDVLFSNWQSCKHEPVLEAELSKYMPSVEVSCQFRVGEKTEWTSLSKFGAVQGKFSAIFVGASIRTLAWVPKHKDDRSKSGQYLTVACYNGSDCTRISYDQTAHFANMIQLWDFGNLQKKPKFAMGIAHNFGTVWGLSWCPSGARDSPHNDTTKLNRLGLFAAAFSNGSAYIFSVPYPSQIVKDDQLVYKLKPVAELRISSLPSSERKMYQASAIRWSTQKGHDVILVGYSDGTIAYYDLSTKSPLLYTKEEDMDVFFPFHDELAHSTCIEDLDIYPSSDPSVPVGMVCSASSYGASLLCCPTRTPTRIYSHIAANHIVFSPNWPSALMSGANAYMQLGGNELEMWCGNRRLGPNEFCCGCNLCGRVVVSSPPYLKAITPHGAYECIMREMLALLREVPLEDKIKNYKDDDLGTPIEPHTYDEVVKKYGIELKMAPSVRQKQEPPPQASPGRFPLADVPAMAFCPSRDHHELLAVATHSGLIFLAKL